MISDDEGHNQEVLAVLGSPKSEDDRENIFVQTQK